MADAKKSDEETHLCPLQDRATPYSRQFYIDVIAGQKSFPSDAFLDNSESGSLASNIPTKSPESRQANSPYVIGFHDAYEIRGLLTWS